jgi:hypothetical protein
MILLIFSIFLYGCEGDDNREPARGRQLLFVADHPRWGNEVIFTDGLGQKRLIRPKASNRQIAVVNIIVANKSTTMVSLLLNESAVELGDRRSDRLEAVDPFNADVLEAEKVTEERKGRFLMILGYLGGLMGQKTPVVYEGHRGAVVLDEPPLWGEVELKKDFQIEGWFVFDVPKGLKLGTLWWNQADTVSIDFIEY